MSKASSHIPAGYHTLTPYLIVRGAAQAIAWYQKVLGAQEIMRMPAGDRIGHAELRIGDSVFMLADEHPEIHAFAPKEDRTPVGILVYLPDVDSVFEKAVAEGAKVEQKPEDKFYGDRSAGIVDPFGHRWYISTHVEDVTPEEMKQRMAAMAK